MTWRFFSCYWSDFAFARLRMEWIIVDRDCESRTTCPSFFWIFRTVSFRISSNAFATSGRAIKTVYKKDDAAAGGSIKKRNPVFPVVDTFLPIETLLLSAQSEEYDERNPQPAAIFDHRVYQIANTSYGNICPCTIFRINETSWWWCITPFAIYALRILWKWRNWSAHGMVFAVSW